MNLGKHIHTLLKRQAEVHVPGLGSFKRVYNPATFDEEKNVFMPPVSYIEFDSLSTSGFDFVGYFQQVNQLGRSEAERIVTEEVSSISAALDLSGEVSLEGLGQLVSYGNTAVFKPFDLSGFNFEPVETTIPHENVRDEQPAESEIEESIAEEETEVLPPVMVEEKPEEIEATNESVAEEETLPNADELEEEEPSRSRSSLYVMIAVLALLALGGIYYFTQYNNKIPQATASTDRQDTTATEVPIESPIDTAVTTTVDTQATMSTAVETSIAEADESKKFTIVIGTHRTLAKAYEEAEAFNKDGHKTVRVVTPNLAKNLKRVIWDTYATKAERDSALQYVRKHIKTDAWPDVLK